MADNDNPPTRDNDRNKPESVLKDNLEDLENGSDQFIPVSKKEVPSLMTLEQIITFTGELEHLNELVVLHLEKSGGFSSTAEYFSCVQPLLDRLESEIRRQCWTNQSHDQIKQIVKDWIDREITTLP
jgi:hypothetical protein